MHPSFSIVTPSFNASNTILNAIDSVLSQNYDSFEYFVVDGGSTDGTVGLLNSISDPRFHFISEPDKGIYDAMNKSLKYIHGDFVLFLGADDIMFDENVLGAVSGKVGNFEDVYYGDVMLSASRIKYSGKFSKVMWGYKNVCHQSIFYPRGVFDSFSYQTIYKLAADWALNLELIANGKQFVYIDEVIALYNNLDGASSMHNDEVFLKDRKVMTIEAIGIGPYLCGQVIKGIKKIKSIK